MQSLLQVKLIEFYKQLDIGYEIKGRSRIKDDGKVSRQTAKRMTTLLSN